jgi:two-component system CheB/CheR fusion protein
LLFPVAAIGASTGGFDAVLELLAALPPKSETAYVIVQDWAAESLLPEILQKSTVLAVTQIRDESIIEPGHVYVTPPNVTVTLVGDHFQLNPRSDAADREDPIDVFFNSLATARTDTAIGVILAGAGTDGALGIRAIKLSGGITYAQAPDSTTLSGMPQRAIETGCIDFVLRPSEIGAELMRLDAHPYLRAVSSLEAQPNASENGATADDESLTLVFRRLRTAHGLDFSHYKRSTLRRRLARRMALRKVDDLAVYVGLLEDDPAETAALYQDFLIRVTGFFRDPQSFEGLRVRVFPTLCEGHSTKDPIRVWVPGCATGEEVYSIAMALVEYLGDRLPFCGIQLFGTDVSDAAIEKARAAFYHKSLVEDLPVDVVQRFFVKQDDHFRIAKSIRDLCIFARQDVTRDPPFSRLDLVSCRNLLIYLDGPAQRHVMQVFHYSLRPQGFLMLGPSESVGAATDLFELFDKHHRFYRRKAMPPGAGLELAPRGRATYSRSRSVPPGEDPIIVEADSAQREADRLLLAQYAPASLLVDESLNILQYRGETGRYVEHASGPPSHNLSRIVRPELLVALSPAIQEARESGSTARREGVCTDEFTDITLQVIPLKASSTQRCYLIVFEDASRRPTGRRAQQAPSSALPESEKDRRLMQLERELAATRDYLQATMEEQEAVKEELRSAHEEVLSANEEYQSTNEELETAKEELQSANEELTTTNDELRNRNTELSALNGELKRTRDISDRGRAYADALVESLREPLVVLDEQLTIVRANAAFFRDFKIDRDACAGRALRDIAAQMWNIPELFDQLELVAARDAVIDGLPLNIAVPEVGARCLRVKACKVPGDRDRTELILLAIEDVTELKATADQLRETDQRKDEFLATLAHELRNPLAPITHALHLLRSGSGEVDRTRLYELMARQTVRLVRLVDELLDVARIRRGDIDIKSELVDLADSVRHAVEATRPRIDERDHELSVELPNTPLFVKGDPVRLEQIVSNILENAAKYTHSGGRIRLSVAEHNGLGLLKVSDNGIGLAPEHLDTIFDLFTRIDSSVGRLTGGLGIGLSLVRRVLALQGGTISAHSAGIGKGTEFVVQLPLSTPSGPVVSESDREPNPPLRPHFRRRVLIVDDNPDTLEPLSFLVRSWGHDVAIARDGASALELSQRFRPDRALVDIGLPGMTGYQLAKRLRAQSQHRDLLLIAITGHGRAEDRMDAYAAGFDAHFIKPADLQELQHLLANGGSKREPPTDQGT